MKKRLISAVIAIILCIALSVVAFADASGNPVEYDSVAKEYYGKGNYNYSAYSALYEDGGNYYRAATWVETIGHGSVPAGKMKAESRLYSGTGIILQESGEVSNKETTYFMFAATSRAYSRSGAWSWGTVKLYNGTNFVSDELEKTDVIGALAYSLSYQLTDDEYPVNSNGKTYGSAVLSEIVGYEPDLIYAMGTKGQLGFIKQEDITPADTDTPEKALAYMETRPEKYTIPLYNLEEEVIGEFEISADFVTASTLEEAKEIMLTRGVNTYSGPVEQTSLVNGKFPVNINGETYGNGLMAIEVGHSPDLLSAYGTNDQKGYIKESDIRSCPEDATAQEVYEWFTSQPTSYEIPLYDFQGNVIGAFLVERGTLTDKEIEAKIH